ARPLVGRRDAVAVVVGVEVVGPAVEVGVDRLAAGRLGAGGHAVAVVVGVEVVGGAVAVRVHVAAVGALVRGRDAVAVVVRIEVIRPAVAVGVPLAAVVVVLLVVHQPVAVRVAQRGVDGEARLGHRLVADEVGGDGDDLVRAVGEGGAEREAP